MTEELSHIPDRAHELIQQQLRDLIEKRPGLYYQPTIDVAREIYASLQQAEHLAFDEHMLIKDLSIHDIQLALSQHEQK